MGRTFKPFVFRIMINWQASEESRIRYTCCSHWENAGEGMTQKHYKPIFCRELYPELRDSRGITVESVSAMRKWPSLPIPSTLGTASPSSMWPVSICALLPRWFQVPVQLCKLPTAVSGTKRVRSDNMHKGIRLRHAHASTSFSHPC
jgi:hypothetical protein